MIIMIIINNSDWLGEARLSGALGGAGRRRVRGVLKIPMIHTSYLPYSTPL